MDAVIDYNNIFKSAKDKLNKVKKIKLIVLNNEKTGTKVEKDETKVEKDETEKETEKEKEKETDKDVISIVEKPLEYKLVKNVRTINSHIKMRKEKMCKKKIKPEDSVYNVYNLKNENEIGEYIDIEIIKHIENKKWKSLDMCFKWKYISEYLNLKNATEPEIKSIKNALLDGKLKNVEYTSGNVISINYMSL